MHENEHDRHKHNHAEHVEAVSQEHVEDSPAEKAELAETSKDEALESARSDYKGALAEFKVARQKVIDTRTTFKTHNARVKAEKASSKEPKAA